MANNVVMPANLVTVDDRSGNSYMIFDVVIGALSEDVNETYVILPDSAISAAELPASNAAPVISLIAGSDTATVNPSTDEMAVINDTSTASGLGFTFVAGDGVKQLIIDQTVAAGTYKIVVRCTGSAAGTGSTNAANL